MSAPASGIRHVHHFRRPTPTTSTKTSASPDSGLGELIWSLRLLCTTRIKVSLFRLIIAGLASDFAVRSLDRAFGPKGLGGRLPDGSLVLMLIGLEADDEAVIRDVVARLARAIATLDPDATTGGIELAVLNRTADEIGDPEDALLHLLALPMRTHASGQDIVVTLRAA